MCLDEPAPCKRQTVVCLDGPVTSEWQTVVCLDERQTGVCLDGPVTSEQQTPACLDEPVTSERHIPLVCLDEPVTSERQTVVCLDGPVMSERQTPVCLDEQLTSEQQPLVCLDKPVASERQTLVCLDDSGTSERQPPVCLDDSVTSERQSPVCLDDSVTSERQPPVCLDDSVTSERQLPVCLNKFVASQQTLSSVDHPVTSARHTPPKCSDGLVTSKRHSPIADAERRDSMTSDEPSPKIWRAADTATDCRPARSDCQTARQEGPFPPAARQADVRETSPAANCDANRRDVGELTDIGEVAPSEVGNGDSDRRHLAIIGDTLRPGPDDGLGGETEAQRRDDTSACKRPPTGNASSPEGGVERAVAPEPEVEQEVPLDLHQPKRLPVT